MKEEALDRTLWRIHFGGSYGPLVDIRRREWIRRYRMILLRPQKENQSVEARVEDGVRLCPHFVRVSFYGTMFQYFIEHSVPRH
jgi:hypothetical protein